MPELDRILAFCGFFRRESDEYQKTHTISIYLIELPDIYRLSIVDNSVPGSKSPYTYDIGKEDIVNPGDWLDQQGLNLSDYGYTDVYIYFKGRLVGHYG